MRRYGKKLTARIKEARANKEATLEWNDEERQHISHTVRKDRHNRNILATKVIVITGRNSMYVTSLDKYHAGH
jgi:hypothetical protein